MTYSYDHRSAASPERPLVAIRFEGGWAIISVLVGASLGAYKRRLPEDGVEGLRPKLDALKGQLEALSGASADERAHTLLESEGFRFSTSFGDRDPALAKLQLDRRRDQGMKQVKALGSWLRDGVVALVEGTYRDFRSGRLRKEPCVTASYMRATLHEIPGWHEHQVAFNSLSTKKQLALCHYALESARKRGQLGSSLGSGPGGRETRCYEPTR